MSFITQGAERTLLEAAVILNAAWTAYCLRQEFCTTNSDLGVAFGAYDLVSHYVRLPLSPPGQITEEEKGLFTPPADIESFRRFALKICSGKLIQNLLAGAERRSA